MECYRDQRAKMKKETGDLKEQIRLVNVRLDATEKEFDESKKEWMNESVNQ